VLRVEKSHRPEQNHFGDVSKVTVVVIIEISLTCMSAKFALVQAAPLQLAVSETH